MTIHDDFDGEQHYKAHEARNKAMLDRWAEMDREDQEAAEKRSPWIVAAIGVPVALAAFYLLSTQHAHACERPLLQPEFQTQASALATTNAPIPTKPPVLIVSGSQLKM